ncbi:DHS-like NAD/FAD-binding domain-containing protein [Schizopora paradoxa]|uniref:DHS-like NAD/FAD-binding domain-containing protein n=1 Tax=Schizopora paradoxa TaxID=27342 RepID=A0A0H2RGB1_9AGAM|nr:DHS-like NAD/FAD-binding domain-containing protein [Schizopora paradoxa]
MKINIPTIPPSILAAAKLKQSTPIDLPSVVERIAAFLAPGNVAVLTGAGVSVDSGIRAYRGDDGRYMNPNYKPILYHELMDESLKGYAFRQRYWLRSYLGYPPVRDAQPNTTHFALAALQYLGIVSRLITQNVDGLHHKAISTVWDQYEMERKMLEIHGTLHRVHCTFGHVVDRQTFQDRISAANPYWAEFTANMERTEQKPRTNPDGDVVLEGVDYGSFVIPDCPECTLQSRRNSIQKPNLIFFGESISAEVKERSYRDVEFADRLFIVGTTLATFSAFRLLKHAIELRKPVLMLNVGPTRADTIPGLEKIEVQSGAVLRDIVKSLAGFRAVEDPILRRLLTSGIVKPPAREATNEDITPSHVEK